jgi:hypothetical protein
MRFKVFEAIFFELDWLLQKPGVATRVNVQSQNLRAAFLIAYHAVSSYMAYDGPQPAPALGYLREHTILVCFIAQRIRCSLCHSCMLSRVSHGTGYYIKLFRSFSYQFSPSMGCTPTYPAIHLAKHVERDMDTLLALLGPSLYEEYIP